MALFLNIIRIHLTAPLLFEFVLKWDKNVINKINTFTVSGAM